MIINIKYHRYNRLRNLLGPAVDRDAAFAVHQQTLRGHCHGWHC